MAIQAGWVGPTSNWVESRPGQNSVAQPTLILGQVRPNYLAKEKFWWAGRAIPSWAKTGLVQI